MKKKYLYTIVVLAIVAAMVIYNREPSFSDINREESIYIAKCLDGREVAHAYHINVEHSHYGLNPKPTPARFASNKKHAFAEFYCENDFSDVDQAKGIFAGAWKQVRTIETKRRDYRFERVNIEYDDRHAGSFRDRLLISLTSLFIIGGVAIFGKVRS